MTYQGEATYEPKWRCWQVTGESSAFKVRVAFCPYYGRALHDDGTTGPDPQALREALERCVFLLEHHGEIVSESPWGKEIAGGVQQARAALAGASRPENGGG